MSHNVTTYDLQEAIATSIKEELTKSMTTFGFTILQALVNDIRP